MGRGKRGGWWGTQTYAHTLTKGTHGSISLSIVCLWIDFQRLCLFPKNNMQVTRMYVLKIERQHLTSEPLKHTHTRLPVDEAL